MNTPSRREFFTYAAAATLASALPASAQTKKDQAKNDTTRRPLVVDVIGPMAFRWSGGKFELWMPDLSDDRHNREPNIPPHQAGITTPVKGFVLPNGYYEISGIEGSGGNHVTPHRTGGGQIYQRAAADPKEYYIRISLPMPFKIVLLNPTSAKIWSVGDKEPDHYTDYAVGLRLLYAKAGTPKLSGLYGTSLPEGAPKDKVIPFDPDPAEVQLDMSITYSPYNAGDPNDARISFKELAKLLKLDLDFKEEKKSIPSVSRQNPCKSAVMQLTWV